jgi:hypothetical protein
LDRGQAYGPISWELYGKENDDKAYCNASVEGSRKDVVVSHPPAEVVTTHDPLEEESGH